MSLAAKLGVSLEQFYDLPESEDWIADWELEHETCPTHHGPRSECSDAEQDWFPQLTVCHPTMQLAAANRRYDKIHENAPYHDGFFRLWSENPSAITPFHYREGVTIWLSKEDLTPDDDFLAQKKPELPGQSVQSGE